MTSVRGVAGRLAKVRERIADAGGDPDAIEIVAVTKGLGADAVRAAHAAGLRAIGENYAQELLAKHAEVSAGGVAADWHFIGRLQSNKVRQLTDAVTCWQSVDRTSLVDEIAKRAPGATVLVQVDPADDGSKGGASVADAAALVSRARDLGLDVRGVMCVGVDGDPAATVDSFRRTAALADRLGLPVRSFGMTADLAAAVEAGTTMVRVGTGLFGPRPGAGGSRAG